MYDEDEFEEQEIAIRIEPKEEVLEQHGISFEAFEEALGNAIDAHEAKLDSLGEDEDTPSIEEMNIRIGDRDFLLRELADISISEDSEE